MAYLAKPTICKTGEMDEIVATASLGLIVQQTWPKIHLQVCFRDVETDARSPHQTRLAVSVTDRRGVVYFRGRALVVSLVPGQAK